MLFLLNLLTSNVIYHNICILSTLILKNLMYLKSIDELPTPFPLSAFITFHSLSLPSVAFHYLLSPLLFHTSVFHAPLSAPLCFASLFLLSLFYSLHCFALLCVTSPIVLRPLFYFLPLCFTLSHCLHPLRFIYSHCFAPVFLLPGNLRKPVPDTAKGNVFLIFQKNFAKSP